MSADPESTGSAPTVWRTAGGDVGRSGCSPERLRADPQAKRTLNVGGTIKASVIFDDSGNTFVTDLQGAVQAFASDGTRRWRTDLRAGIEATPVLALDDSRLFVGTLHGSALALDPQSGAILWRRQLPTQSDPRILSDLLHEAVSDSLVLSSWGGRWFRLDGTTGEERGTWDAGVYPQSAAAADAAGNIFLLRAMWDQGVECVRVNTANEATVLYREPESSRGARRMLVAAAPVVTPGCQEVSFVVNRDRDCTVHHWSMATGSELWRQALPAAVKATPARNSDGALFVADLAGTVHALSPDGRLLWQYNSGCEYLLAAPVVDASGVCWLGDPLGRLHRIGTDGSGETVFNADRSIEAQASVSPRSELLLPVTHGEVHVFEGNSLPG